MASGEEDEIGCARGQDRMRTRAGGRYSNLLLVGRDDANERSALALPINDVLMTSFPAEIVKIRRRN